MDSLAAAPARQELPAHARFVRGLAGQLVRVHASRAAWTAPLLGFAEAPLAKGTAASATGVLLMTTTMKIVFAVSLAVTGALGVWVGTRIAAAPRESAQAARGLERAAVDETPRPTREPGARSGTP